MKDLLSTLNIVVIGMLGGPGSGKGTQCRLLADAFNLRHLSVGDVLRTEMNREGSPFVEEIRNNMLAGRVGPKEITVGVLRQHIVCAMQEGIKTFVLDGFPRDMAQSEYFEEHIAPIQHLIVLECPDEILVRRLGHRDRFDDAPENVLRRIHTFRDVTSRVVEHFELMQKVARINSNQDLDKVSSEVRKTLTSVVGLRALPHTVKGGVDPSSVESG